MEEEKLNTENKDRIVCPHCGYKFPGKFKALANKGVTECWSCLEEFYFKIETKVIYSTKKTEYK